MICSICHKPIRDMCQAHYGDDGGPICTGCLGIGFVEIVEPRRSYEVKWPDKEEWTLINDHVGEW